MRAKKRILLIDQDEPRLMVMRYTLRQWAFDVEGYNSCMLGEIALPKYEPNVLLIVGDHPQIALDSLVDAAGSMRVKSLYVTLRDRQGTTLEQEAWLATYWGRPDTAFLIELLKTMSVGKRGPAPGFAWVRVEGQVRAARA